MIRQLESPTTTINKKINALDMIAAKFHNLNIKNQELYTSNKNHNDFLKQMNAKISTESFLLKLSTPTGRSIRPTCDCNYIKIAIKIITV